jgi:hypothetical protein
MRFSFDVQYLFSPDHYDLTDGDLKDIALYCSVLICAIGFLSVFTLKDTKRIAWGISLVNSVVLTVGSLVYLIAYAIPTHPQLLSFQPKSEIFYGVSNGGMILCIWFALANILDLLFGLVFYRSKMGLLSSFIHHPVFIWMSLFAGTGNGLFTSDLPFIQAYNALFLVEVPTMLLAFGSVWPSLRTDMGFGATFFLFRLVYHGYMMALAVHSGVNTPLLCCFVGPFFLHVFWFSTWLKSYAFGKKKGKDPKRE